MAECYGEPTVGGVGVSKTGYTMKSVKENTSGGIVYESAMREEGEKE